MAISVLLLLAVVGSAGAFQPHPAHSIRWAIGPSPQSRTIAPLTLVKGKGDFDDREEIEYDGDVDWDAEWKKVMAQQNTKTERPGKDFYKSDVEKAAIKSVNKVAEGVAKATEKLPRVEAPNVRSLQGDWKFWIGVLVVISVGTSLLAASGQSTSSFTNDPGSYYI